MASWFAENYPRSSHVAVSGLDSRSMCSYSVAYCRDLEISENACDLAILVLRSECLDFGGYFFEDGIGEVRSLPAPAGASSALLLLLAGVADFKVGVVVFGVVEA